jgi:hypothetical protein
MLFCPTLDLAPDRFVRLVRLVEVAGGMQQLLAVTLSTMHAPTLRPAPEPCSAAG